MSKQIQVRWMFTLVFLAIVNLAFSQKRYELTVKEAVELAFNNVTAVKNAALDIQIQQAQNREITGQALPQLAGTASLNRYLQLPKILFPDASKTGIYNVLIDEKILPSDTKIPTPVVAGYQLFSALECKHRWNTIAIAFSA
ncbi:MAG: hypothetical protein WKG06_05725 [Segetibacter sp.]